MKPNQGMISDSRNCRILADNQVCLLRIGPDRTSTLWNLFVALEQNDFSMREGDFDASVVECLLDLLRN